MSFASIQPGVYALDVFKDNHFLARYKVSLPYFPSNFGATLYKDESLTIWTADPMFNVFKETSPPQKKSDKISIFAGRNEWEPFQIIFRPNSKLEDFQIKVSDLKGPSIIPAKLVDIYKVEYVPITIPTDPDGMTGDFPDPLVKVEGPITLDEGRNHPFWLELRIPSNAKPGIYKGEISAFSGDKRIASIPLEIRVFNFSLPLKPEGFHIHTAYGMDVNLGYHKANPEDRAKILPFYLRLFADHHLSPYNPFAYPIKYNLNPGSLELSNGKIKASFPKSSQTIARLYLADVPLANLNFCLDQREKQSVSWPSIEQVKPKVVISGPLRYKVRIEAKRISSSTANRAYETEEEIEMFAGQKWISRKLISLKSSDENPYSIAYYFLLLSPINGGEPLNGPDWSIWKTSKGLACAFSLSPGQFGFGFWRDASGGTHGDITRDVNLEMERGKEALREPQPTLFVALTKDEEEMRAIKNRLSHPLEVQIEKGGKEIELTIRETGGIKREREPLVVSLGELAKGWRYARAWQGKKEIPSQLDGDELTLLLDLPANGEAKVKVEKAGFPWKGKGIVLSEKEPSVDVDFSQFIPSAHYALDELGFSDYNICSALDMGWLWRNESLSEEEKMLYRELGRKVEDFLKRHNWLNKAYCYWFDEPEEKDYPFVIKGMKLLKATFPNVRRLLTEQPEPPLYRYVDIWVPVLPLYNEARCRERQKEGQEVWWYVCCGPRHPYPNNFIDYPGIEHRIRLWMNWKYKVTGDLYWSTTYWHKNPWQTPMSYWPDDKGMWGNGDGYLLYPPERGEAKEEFIGGPVPSIRIKMIREGIEDAEYLWMLEEKIKGMRNPPKEAIEALNSAKELVRSLTEFCHSPEELEEVRLIVAEALEKLTK
ncbi:MAG: glycoside hydrolase domain-containing protein [bacterium]